MRSFFVIAKQVYRKKFNIKPGDHNCTESEMIVKAERQKSECMKKLQNDTAKDLEHKHHENLRNTESDKHSENRRNTESENKHGKNKKPEKKIKVKDIYI